MTPNFIARWMPTLSLFGTSRLCQCHGWAQPQWKFGADGGHQLNRLAVSSLRRVTERQHPRGRATAADDGQRRNEHERTLLGDQLQVGQVFEDEPARTVDHAVAR